MGLPVLMADSVNPHTIPEKFKRNPNGVAGYVDGPLSAWTPHEFRSFPRVWRITVTGSLAVAARARVIDVETYDATPADVPAYREERHALTGEPTVVYCDRSTVPLVIAADAQHLELEWWIAVLGGKFWTIAQLNDWLQANYQLQLPPDKVRGIQDLDTGPYDVSQIFGSPSWETTPS